MHPNREKKTGYTQKMPAAWVHEEYDLDEILAEYGAAPEQTLLRQAGLEEPKPETPLPKEPELPKAPAPITLEDVVGNTVDAVMKDEQKAVKIKEPKKGLFSRRKMEETEQLYEQPKPKRKEPAEPEREEIGPEPDDLLTVAEKYRMRGRNAAASLFGALLVALIPVVLMILEYAGVWVPYWSQNLPLQSACLLVCVVVQLAFCRAVAAKAIRMLRRKQCGSELLIVLAALAAAGDCVVQLCVPSRSAVPVYAGVSCAALAFALWGVWQESRGMYDTLRSAALDTQPPYLVTETERGACKQKGRLAGFYTALKKPDISKLWQVSLTPVILMASVIFAGLSSLGLGRNGDFLLNWSVILTAGATFAWPLCWSLPFARLAGTLQKLGCAVAGWHGAERISCRKSMIVTEEDLFPLNAVLLNGVKVFGEELQKTDSYAASMSKAAGSALQQMFDKRLRTEGGHYYEVKDFSFYEEGGYSGRIRGETVLFGTASFMRKMDIRLPGNINLKTGLFLSVDGELVAVYALKYLPADNVDYALNMIRRGRLTPILASRDPNVTPALLKRKFNKLVRVEYPSLTERVALSEAGEDQGMPRAVLFREGLLAYAEVAAGSHRLCMSVRRSTLLAVLGSIAGTLLSFYLVFVEGYNLLTPMALEAFLLLWTLPVLLMSDRAGRD